MKQDQLYSLKCQALHLKKQNSPYTLQESSLNLGKSIIKHINKVQRKQDTFRKLPWAYHYRDK